MLYLHDVWVNWFEGEENAYNVAAFHEWRKDDKIELLEQVPLLYITEELFLYIENDMQDLPETLLNKIYKRGFIRKGQNKIVLEYGCILTDGRDVIAIDTLGYAIPIRKSRLIPRQEKIVYDMIKDIDVSVFKLSIKHYKKKYSILSMKPRLIYGLTRRERQLKHVLMITLDQLRTANNIEELKYWLTEWNPGKFPNLGYMDKREVWQMLYDGIQTGWTKRHEEIGSKLIRGQPFLENMWHLEQKQNTSKLK